MTSCAFLTIPREIRDIIYTYVLAPTGYEFLVCLTGHSWHRYWILLPVDPSDSFDIVVPFECDNHIELMKKRLNHLSILRACRQAYIEGKEVYWRANTITFADPYRLTMISRRFPIGRIKPLRHLRLTISLMGDYHLHFLGKALNHISKSIEQGLDLGSVTLRLEAGAVRRPRIMMKGMFVHALERFRSICANEVYKWKDSMKRRLEILDIDSKGFVKYCQRVETAKALHDEFGGELWINGRLHYKDGREILSF